MRQIMKKSSRHLYVKLTENERKEHSEILVRKLEEKDSITLDAKFSANSFKRTLNESEKSIMETRKALTKGIEQLVDCVEYLDESTDEIIVVRADTNEEVQRRKACDEDYQTSLILDVGEELPFRKAM